MSPPPHFISLIIFSHRLLAAIKRNYEKLQLEKSVPRPTFEPENFRIRSRSVTHSTETFVIVV
jgi:hypothetical protein